MSKLVVHQPQLVKIAELNPAAYNPRKISDLKYAALKKSIETEGFVEPMVVQKSGMRIIGGHQRLRALKDICEEQGLDASLAVGAIEIPCVVLDISDVKAKKLNIKLNQGGDFDAEPLGELLIDIGVYPNETLNVREVNDLGFTEKEALKFIHLVEPPEAAEPTDADGKTFGRSPTLSLEFTTESDRDRMKRHLAALSEVEGKRTGDIVMGLLKKRADAAPSSGVKKKSATKKKAAKR